METKCTIFKIENASPCTYIWYPTTSHHTPAAMQAGPAASSLLPCFHLCPPPSGLHLQPEGLCQNLHQIVPHQWLHGHYCGHKVLQGLAPLSGQPHHPPLPLTRSAPAHQLPRYSSNTPARFLPAPFIGCFLCLEPSAPASPLNPAPPSGLHLSAQWHPGHHPSTPPIFFPSVRYQPTLATSWSRMPLTSPLFVSVCLLLYPPTRLRS